MVAGQARPGRREERGDGGEGGEGGGEEGEGDLVGWHVCYDYVYDVMTMGLLLHALINRCNIRLKIFYANDGD